MAAPAVMAGYPWRAAKTIAATATPPRTTARFLLHGAGIAAFVLLGSAAAVAAQSPRASAGGEAARCVVIALRLWVVSALLTYVALRWRAVGMILQLWRDTPLLPAWAAIFVSCRSRRSWCEALTNAYQYELWGYVEQDDAVFAAAVAPVLPDVPLERVREGRRRLAELSARWDALAPGDALELILDA